MLSDSGVCASVATTCNVDTAASARHPDATNNDDDNDDTTTTRRANGETSAWRWQPSSSPLPCRLRKRARSHSCTNDDNNDDSRHRYVDAEASSRSVSLVAHSDAQCDNDSSLHDDDDDDNDDDDDDDDDGDDDDDSAYDVTRSCVHGTVTTQLVPARPTRLLVQQVVPCTAYMQQQQQHGALPLHAAQANAHARDDGDDKTTTTQAARPSCAALCRAVQREQHLRTWLTPHELRVGTLIEVLQRQRRRARAAAAVIDVDDDDSNNNVDDDSRADATATRGDACASTQQQQQQHDRCTIAYEQQRCAALLAQHDAWHSAAQPRACVVEWCNGVVGATADVHGLLDEQRLRAEYTHALLPPPPPTLSIAQCSTTRPRTHPHNGHDAHAMAASPSTSVRAPVGRLPPHTLRNVAHVQLQRLRSARRERTAFLRRWHTALDVATQQQQQQQQCDKGEASAHTPSLSSSSLCRTSCMRHDDDNCNNSDDDDDATRASVTGCACHRCCALHALFAQVVDVSGGVCVFVQQLHHISALTRRTTTTTTTTATATGSVCMPHRHRTQRPRARAACKHNNTTGSSRNGVNVFTAFPLLRRTVTDTAAHVCGGVIASNNDENNDNNDNNDACTSTACRAQSSPHAPPPPPLLRSVCEAVLDEVLRIAVAPRGQPCRLRLLAPSVAYSALLACRAEALLHDYCAHVVPRLLAATTAEATSKHDAPCGSSGDDDGGGEATTATTTASSVAAAYTRALLTRLRAALPPSVWRDVLYNSRTLAQRATTACACAHVNTTATAATTTATATASALTTTVAAAAAQHADTLLASVADNVLRHVLTALRIVLLRRTFVMYELLRIATSRTLRSTHRSLALRYRIWYYYTPSPAAVLRLLQYNSLFATALSRAFPRHVRPSTLSSSPSFACYNNDNNNRTRDEASVQAACVDDFVPEMALLDAHYLERFALHIIETYHTPSSASASTNNNSNSSSNSNSSAACAAPLSCREAALLLTSNGAAVTMTTSSTTPPTASTAAAAQTTAAGRRERRRRPRRGGGGGGAAAAASDDVLSPLCHAHKDAVLRSVVQWLQQRGRTMSLDEMDSHSTAHLSRSRHHH